MVLARRVEGLDLGADLGQAVGAGRVEIGGGVLLGAVAVGVVGHRVGGAGAGGNTVLR